MRDEILYYIYCVHRLKGEKCACSNPLSVDLIQMCICDEKANVIHCMHAILTG